MFLFQTCLKSLSIFASSVQQQSLFTGASDVIIVKHNSIVYKTTPFLACFGSYAVLNKMSVNIFVNDVQIHDVKFQLDGFGYISPMYLKDTHIKKMGLKFGKNKLRYELGQTSIEVQIHLYSDSDKILVSDVDGTLTKSDIIGCLHNSTDSNYLHEDYTELIQKIKQNGYKIIWLSMRPMALYNYSKRYIQKNVGVEGALLLQPEQFFPALKSEFMKKSGHIKSNLIIEIKKLFPLKINPFVAGFGNVQNDAIAYYYCGIPLERIYIINDNSQIHQMHQHNNSQTYRKILQQIQSHFPKRKSLKMIIDQNLKKQQVKQKKNIQK